MPTGIVPLLRPCQKRRCIRRRHDRTYGGDHLADGTLRAGASVENVAAPPRPSLPLRSSRRTSLSLWSSSEPHHAIHQAPPRPTKTEATPFGRRDRSDGPQAPHYAARASVSEIERRRWSDSCSICRLRSPPTPSRRPISSWLWTESPLRP